MKALFSVKLGSDKTIIETTAQLVDKNVNYV